ncbi:MAG: hypothetical protein R3F61_06260 [Myxococcota bacterium]
MSHIRTLASLAVLTGLFATGLACEFGSASGDRALSGECPERSCSSATPNGLIFYGQTLYDDEADRLGPVAVGGTFSLRFGVPEGELGDWDVVVEPEGAVQVERTGSRTLLVRGAAEGEAMIRIVDARSGQLYDRIPFRAVPLAEVVVGNAKSSREFLVAGCGEMVGIDLFHADGRAFDLETSLLIDGQAVAERWDCYQVDVPTGITELELTVSAGSSVHTVTMPVVEGDCLSYWD